MINKVILVARLGQDPEAKFTPEGTAVTTFSVATSESWKDKNTGEKQEKTEWHRIVAWRKLAEICGQYLKKGSLVYLEGKLQTRTWEDKDGSKRYATEVVIHDMKMLGGKGEASSSNSSSSSRHEPPARDETPEEDMPF